jgi:23S rRNA (uracil1939-C5)-methyltransferase
MSPQVYSRWKHDLVAKAMHAQGLDIPVGSLLPIPPRSRRRAVFTSQMAAAGSSFGFHARRTHAVVDIMECPVMVPAISSALADLKSLVATLPRRAEEVRVTVAALDGGLDVALAGSRGKLSPAERARLAERAATSRIARLTVDGDIIATHVEPSLVTSAGAIVPPPGAFFQAVSKAEDAMVQQVVIAVGKAKRIVDLFAGLGTFSLPLARVGRVLAVDSDKSLLAALSDAARKAQGLKPIETKLRDLFREPLSLKELEGADAVVFDPPRAGAEAQVQVLARSPIKTLVAVSCNPQTLARDARILRDGGYACVGVAPIDQFLYTPHIEAVAVFRRT